MPKATLPERLKRAREAKNLNCSQLADELGLDRSTVSHWELGIAAPRKKTLPSVSRALAIPLPELQRLYLEFTPIRKAS